MDKGSITEKLERPEHWWSLPQSSPNAACIKVVAQWRCIFPSVLWLLREGRGKHAGEVLWAQGNGWPSGEKAFYIPLAQSPKAWFSSQFWQEWRLFLKNCSLQPQLCWILPWDTEFSRELDQGSMLVRTITDKHLKSSLSVVAKASVFSL